MAISYEAVPALEYASHVDVEQLGNPALFAVVGGCLVSESGADMVVTVGAGLALVNGALVTVAGNTITLVSDASNERYNYATINSSGVAVVVLGTAAASPAVEPTKPDPSGKTILKMYKVEAAQTIAANIATAPDKRILVSQYASRSLTDFTKNANVTMSDVTGIKGYIGASEVWAFEVVAPASIGATPSIKVLFTVPVGATVTGLAEVVATASSATTAAAARVSDFTAAVSLSSVVAGVGLRLSGVVVNSTTPGIVQLQAAQLNSDPSNVILYAQSLIKWTRLA